MELSTTGLLAPDRFSTSLPATLPTHIFIFPQISRFRSPPTRNVVTQFSKEVSNPPTLLPAVPYNSSIDPFTLETRPQIDYYLTRAGKGSVPDPCQIHAQVIKSDLSGCNLIQNKVAILYAKRLPSLKNARRLFDVIPERTLPLYATLIGSYCRSREWVEVLSMFGLMINDGIGPDKYLVPTILKACSGLAALSTGKMLHGFVKRRGLELDVVVGNSIIDMYAKCGDLVSLHRAFDVMPERDVVSWTNLISAYADTGLLDQAMGFFKSMQMTGVKPDLISWNALTSGFAQNGEVEKAIQLLEEMRETGLTPRVNSWNGIISGCVQNALFEDALTVFCKMVLFENPNAVTIVGVLSACAGLKSLKLGKEIHAYGINSELLTNTFVGGSLIDMYSRCGRSDYAERVFKMMEYTNSVVWNEMIAMYTHEGKMKEALDLLHLMQINGLKPDLITYNTLLAGYARRGQKDEAFKLLFGMGQIDLKPNVVSINALISGFQQFGLGIEALKLFRVMQFPKEIIMDDSKSNWDFPPEVLNMFVLPNAVTITSALSACSDLNWMRQGKEIHGYAVRNSLDSNVIVSSAIVDMYAKCQDMCSATKTFHNISDKNTVSWNILMAGHQNSGEPETTLDLFVRMIQEGFVPSEVTLLVLLSACSSLAAWRMGKQLHCYIAKSGFNMSTASLASALIDMYTKCGRIFEARLIFNQTIQRDVALWNSMISGYAIHGKAEEAISLFEQLEFLSLKPDHITFTGLLSACAREGLLEEGWKYFKYMEDNYGIQPTLAHCTCMVGIISGTGLLEEALDFVKRMPYEPDACVWATLLRACRVHSNAKIGERAANALFELEPNNPSNYIVLSNIYAMCGMWDSARDIRIKMTACRLQTIEPCSRIDVGNVTYTFKAGDWLKHELEQILEKWEKMAKQIEEAGYIPSEVVFGDVKEIDPFSCFHTEKLAICFGIISSIAPCPICVSKNVRMCFDCHTSAKFISKIEKREIFVRDGCVYHHFKDGICSCRDKW